MILDAVVKNREIVNLNFKNNKISEKGIMVLRQRWKRLRHLKIINLKGNIRNKVKSNKFYNLIQFLGKKGIKLLI